MRAWFPDELAHAGAEHLDADYALRYDEKAQFDATAEVSVLRTLGLGETSVLVDLGTGTGSLALTAAPFCRRVVAVDPAPAMLAVLEAKVDELGLKNVEAQQAGFLTYEHRGTRPDVVYSRNALHHLPDFWKAIAVQRMAELLRPRGILRLRDIVFSFDPVDADGAIEGWLGSASESPERGWTRTELEDHVREEYSTFAWLLEPMLERAGFGIRDAVYSDSRTYAAYVCVRAAEA